MLSTRCGSPIPVRVAVASVNWANLMSASSRMYTVFGCRGRHESEESSPDSGPKVTMRRHHKDRRSVNNSCRTGGVSHKKALTDHRFC